MASIAYYVLRERTRPSEADAFAYVLDCEFVKNRQDLDGMLQGRGLVPIYAANPTPPGNVFQLIEQFIRANNGGKFLDMPGVYEITYFHTKTGDPPEPTCIAIVTDKTKDGTDPDLPVKEIVDRGRQWEALQRYGDEMLTYRVGLEGHPDHPELLYRQALVQKRFWPLLPKAIEGLTKSRDARPDRAAYAAVLAECYQAAMDRNIPIVGASADEVRQLIINLLETACRLDPNDPLIAERLRSARGASSGGNEGGFFS